MDNSLEPERSLLGQLLWSADPATQNAISLVLVAAVVALLFVYAPLIVRLVRLYLLDRAVREACQLDGRPAEAHREEIARAFARSPVESQWDEFAYRWHAALAEGERERSPVRLLDVFDERPLIPTGPIKNLLPALPGLFLAVGVLGTFVGLASAVSVGAGDAGVAAPSLVADRVGLALRSGLWGLMLSILAIVGGRLLEGVFDRLAESLDLTVERAFGAVSTGELSSLSARAQRDALGELGGELKRFTSDLTERIDRGLQRIEQSTASAASLVSEQQRNALQNVVRELSLQVQTGVEQHLTALHGVLERAVDHQGAVTGGLAEAFDQMAENAQVHVRVTQTLEQSAAAVREAASAMSGTAHDLSPVLEHLRTTGVALSATADTMNATQGVVADSAEGIRGSIDHATAALSEQRQFIETGLGEIRATLELMSTGLGENLNSALRSVDDALEHTVGRLRETIVHSNETIDRLASPVRAAEGTTREMQTALERVRDEVLALGEWMSQSLRPLRSNLTQIEDRAGDITRALVQFGDHAVHVDKTMDALRGEIHEEGRRYRASTTELSRHLQMAVDAAETLRSQASVEPARAVSTAPAPSAALPALEPRMREPAERPPVAPPAAQPAPEPVAPRRASKPLPVRVHGEDRSAQTQPDGATSRPAPPTPAARPAPAPRPAPRPDPTRRASGPAAASTGKLLGPDPYARGGDSADSLDRQRRFLETDRTLHELEIDDPSGVLGEDEELTLSGLLKKPAGAGNGASGASRKPPGRKPSPSDGTAGRADDSGDESGRPRTWQLLGKD